MDMEDFTLIVMYMYRQVVVIQSFHPRLTQRHLSNIRQMLNRPKYQKAKTFVVRDLQDRADGIIEKVTD